MWNWTTAALIIAFILAVGKFLESGYVTSQAVERWKVGLIRFYFWLDQLPARLPKSAFKRYFPVGTLIIVFWARRGSFGRILMALLMLPFVVVGSWILVVLFKAFEVLRTLSPDVVNFLFISGTALLVFEVALHVLLTAFFMLYFSMAIILDIFRRASVGLLDRASAPETKPIGFFSALLSVFVALFTLVGHFVVP
jgi:hypothetical protein